MADVKYTATVSMADDSHQEIELVVIKNRSAGISGPCVRETLRSEGVDTEPIDLLMIERAVLPGLGYRVKGEAQWALYMTYHGLSVEIEVLPL